MALLHSPVPAPHQTTAAYEPHAPFQRGGGLQRPAEYPVAQPEELVHEGQPVASDDRYSPLSDEARLSPANAVATRAHVSETQRSEGAPQPHRLSPSALHEMVPEESPDADVTMIESDQEHGEPEDKEEILSKEERFPQQAVPNDAGELHVPAAEQQYARHLPYTHDSPHHMYAYPPRNNLSPTIPSAPAPPGFFPFPFAHSHTLYPPSGPAAPPAISKMSPTGFVPRQVHVQEPSEDRSRSSGVESSTHAKTPEDEGPKRPVKHSKPNLLSLLRKKALLSMSHKKDQEKKEIPDQVRDNELRVPEVVPAQSAEFSSVVPEQALEETAKHHQDQLHAYESQGEMQLAPPIISNFQSERVIVEFSESELEGSDGGESVDEDLDGEGAVPVAQTRVSRKRSRAQEVEALKIRSIQLGKCPSSLLVKSGSPKTPGALKQPAVTATNTEVDAQSANPLPQTKTRPGSEVITEASRENAAMPILTGVFKKECGTDGSPTNVAITDAAHCEQVQNLPLEAVKESPDEVRPKQETGLVCKDNGHREPKPDTPVTPKASQLSSRAMQTPKPSTEKVSELKRRVDELMRARTARKSPANGPAHTPIADTALGPTFSPDVLGTSVEKPDREKRERLPSLSKSVPAKRARPSGLESERVPQLGTQEKGRYYSGEAVMLEREKRPKIDFPKPLSKKSTDAAEVAEKQTMWNPRVDMEGVSRNIAEEVDPGYVDELKTELETSRQRLASVQEYTQLMVATDLALGNARAKLNCARDRVKQMEQNLRQAQAELDKAEDDFDTLIESSKRTRANLQGLPFYEDLPSISVLDESRGSRHSLPGPTNFNSLSLTGNATELRKCTTRTDPELTEMDMSRTSEQDYVLQTSPYSPSTGAIFTSVLMGLRSYAFFASTAFDHYFDTRDLLLLWSQSAVITYLTMSSSEFRICCGHIFSIVRLRHSRFMFCSYLGEGSY